MHLLSYIRIADLCYKHPAAAQMQVQNFIHFLLNDVLDVGYDNHMEMAWKWKITPIVTGAP